MMNVVAKSGNLAPYLKNTSQAVSTALKTSVKPVAIVEDKVVVPITPRPELSYSLNSVLSRGNLAVRCGITSPLQIRLAHTDIKIPDFTPYRKAATANPRVKSSQTESSRKNFAYVMAGTGVIMGTYAAKNTVHLFVKSMSASADVLALASIEVNLAEIPEGKSVTFKWRGKPLFIRHRTSAEIEKERSVSLSELRDPQQDADRATKPEWLVVLGICTHLGCVPIANAGDFGGYYCPCHGSHYDASGRIRKGPAPLNLEVPPHSYVDESTLIVG